MVIVVDAFGGDNAPVEILKGCAMAVEDFGINIIVTGDESVIKKEAERNNINLKNIKIVNSSSVLPVREEPTQILKKYSDSSMAVGLNLLANGEGDAFISAGSSGGLVVGASLIVKRLKGIKRAAIATLIPSSKGRYMLIDAGANHDCRPEMLAQFAMMGHVYMEKVLNVHKPKVGILNIGVEENKGTQLQKESCQLLRSMNINFIGNIEARDVPQQVADVVVTDGFVGNVLLKYTEGLAKFFMSEIKNVFTSNVITKLASVMVFSKFKSLKNKMDYTEQGGAILLGIKKPVIKAHGSSNAKAIKSAIKQAKSIVENKTVDALSDALQEYIKQSENKN